MKNKSIKKLQKKTLTRDLFLFYILSLCLSVSFSLCLSPAPPPSLPPLCVSVSVSALSLSVCQYFCLSVPTLSHWPMSVCLSLSTYLRGTGTALLHQLIYLFVFSLRIFVASERSPFSSRCKSIDVAAKCTLQNPVSNYKLALL